MVNFFKKWYLIFRLELEIFELKSELGVYLENINRRNKQFNLEMDVTKLHIDLKKTVDKQIRHIDARIKLVKEKKRV